MRAFAAGGRPEVRAATKRPVDRRRRKPGPERFFSPHDFEALILTPGPTGLRVSGVGFSAGGSQSARRRPLRSPSGLRSAGALPNLGGPVFNRQKWPSFQPALTVWPVVCVFTFRVSSWRVANAAPEGGAPQASPIVLLA